MTIEEIINQQENQGKSDMRKVILSVADELKKADENNSGLIADNLTSMVDLLRNLIDDNQETKKLLKEISKKEYPKTEIHDYPKFPNEISIANFPKYPKFPEIKPADNSGVLMALIAIANNQEETNNLLSELLTKNGDIKEEKKSSGGGGNTSIIPVRRVMGQIIKTETPIGTIDGSNTVFRLTRSPFAGFIILALGGTSQTSGVSFTLKENVITYTVAPQLNPDGTTPDHRAIYF